VAQIAGLAFTSDDRVQDMLHNFEPTAFTRCIPDMQARLLSSQCAAWSSDEREDVAQVGW